MTGVAGFLDGTGRPAGVQQLFASKVEAVASAREAGTEDTAEVADKRNRARSRGGDGAAVDLEHEVVDVDEEAVGVVRTPDQVLPNKIEEVGHQESPDEEGGIGAASRDTKVGVNHARRGPVDLDAPGTAVHGEADSQDAERETGGLCFGNAQFVGEPR